MYPEYLSLSDDEIPMEVQPLLGDALPIALSQGYIADSNPEEEEEDPEEDPADGGDDDDDDEVEEDEKEEEGHLALVDSIVVASPTVDLVS
ncbi:hypothetical protein Tco_0342983, partial [Tanacetum coccineum]